VVSIKDLPVVIDGFVVSSCKKCKGSGIVTTAFENQGFLDLGCDLCGGVGMVKTKIEDLRDF